MQYGQGPPREWTSWLLDLTWRLVPSIQEEGGPPPLPSPLWALLPLLNPKNRRRSWSKAHPEAS